MKTAIVYYSRHHGNTKKLLDAISESNEVTLIDVTEQPSADLSAYDRIGLASGIYYNSFSKQLLEFAEKHLPDPVWLWASPWSVPVSGCSQLRIQSPDPAFLRKGHSGLGSHQCCTSLRSQQ